MEHQSWTEMNIIKIKTIKAVMIEQTAETLTISYLL